MFRRPRLLPLERRLAPALFTWTGNGLTNLWHDADNWNQMAVPGPGDTAKITGFAVVALAPAEVGAIELSSGTLVVGSTLKIGQLAPSSFTGSLGGTTFILPSATGVISTHGTTTISGDVQIGGGGTWHNAGTLTLDATLKTDSAVTTLLNTGTVHLQALKFAWDGQSDLDDGEVVNQGRIQVDAGLFGVVRLEVPLVNQGGALTAKSGTFRVQPVQGKSSYDGGILEVTAGAALDLTGNQAVSLQGKFTGSGTGTVSFDGGPYTITGPVSFQFPDNYFVWTSKTQVSGTNLPGGFVVFADTAPISAGLVNQGVTRLVGPGNLTGNVENASGGEFRFESDADFAGTAFRNAGLVRKTGGTGVSSVTAELKSSGTWDAQTGTLQLAATGQSSDNELTGGTWTAAAGAEVEVRGGPYSMTGTFTGGGAIDFAPVGAVAGDTTLSFPAGSFTWTGGTVDMAGTLAVPADKFLTVTGGTLTGGGSLSNKGTTTVSGTWAFGDGTIANAGLLELPGNGRIVQGQSVGHLVNTGVVRKPAGGGSSRIEAAVTGPGVFEVLSGGLTIAGRPGSLFDGLTFFVAPAAQLAIEAVSIRGTMTFTGGGSATLDTTALAADTTLVTAGTSLLYTGGILNFAGFTLTVPAGSVFDWASATLSGPGSLVNNGTIRQIGSGVIQDSAGAVTVANAGLYDFTGDGDIQFKLATTKLVNAGLVRKSGGTGVTQIRGQLGALGKYEVQTGEVEYSAITGGLAEGGAFAVAAGAVVDLTAGGTTPVQGQFTGIGAGLITLHGGQLLVNDTVTFTCADNLFRWTGGFINLNGKVFTVGNGGFFVADFAGNYSFTGAGTVDVQGTARQVGTGNFLLVGSQILAVAGTYQFETNASLTWSSNPGTVVNSGRIRKVGPDGATGVVTRLTGGGTYEVTVGQMQLFPVAGSMLDGGKFTVGKGAVLNLTASGVLPIRGSFTGSGEGRVIHQDNEFLLADDATFNFPDNFFAWSGGRINTNGQTLTNAAGKFVVLEGPNVNIDLLGGGTFANAGTVRHTGTGEFDIEQTGTHFHNTGEFRFESDGVITWNGDPGRFTNSGLIRTAGNAGISHIATVLQGGGVMDVQTGQLTISPLAGSLLDGGTFTVGKGAVLNLTASGVLPIRGSFTGSGEGRVIHRDNEFLLADDATFNFPDNFFAWSGGRINTNGQTLTNAAGKFVVLEGPNVNIDLLGGGTFANAGTVRHTGTGEFDIEQTGTHFHNTGEFRFESDGDISWNNAPGRVTNSGIVRKIAGTGLSFIVGSLPFTNAGGSVDVAIGTLSLPGTLTLGGGSLSGSGTLIAPVHNDGTVAPGVLTVAGNYAQTKFGRLALELGAASDQFIVNGTVALGGMLQLAAAGDFQIGDVIPVIVNDGTDAITGTFQGLAEGATLAAGKAYFQISYKGGTGNDVTLQVVNANAPPAVQFVTVNDGSPQRSQVTSLTVTFSQPVTLPTDPAVAFQLKRQSDGAGVNLAATENGTFVTLTFTGGAVDGKSLADGRYTLTVSAAQIPGFDGDLDGTPGGDFVLVGDPAANGLYRISGDADGNGVVDFADFLAFRAVFGTAAPGSPFDTDGNGVIDFVDFLAFRSRFGTGI